MKLFVYGIWIVVMVMAIAHADDLVLVPRGHTPFGWVWGLATIGMIPAVLAEEYRLAHGD